MIFREIIDFEKILKPNHRLFAIDYGERKLGIAISDALLRIANPISIIIRKTIKKDLRKINEILIKEKYCGFVVGIPMNIDRSISQSSNRIIKFAEIIYKTFNLPVYLQDESYTTIESNNILTQMLLSRKIRNNIDDKIAASIILQRTLDDIDNISR